jgi:hypothetical protein
MTSVLTLTAPRTKSTIAALFGGPRAVILAVGAIIAIIAPFDTAFDALSLGSPILRPVLLLALGAIGLVLAARIGAGVEPRGLTHPVLSPLLLAAAVAVYVAIMDAFIFRAELSPDYVTLIARHGLLDRFGYFMLRAFNESILYRLFLSSVLVWLLGRFWQGENGMPANGAYWLGMTLAQAVNIGINVTFATGFATTPELIAHDILRYVVPGVVWGYLYFRHGFIAHEIAAVGTHLYLQPLLGLTIR